MRKNTTTAADLTRALAILSDFTGTRYALDRDINGTRVREIDTGRTIGPRGSYSIVMDWAHAAIHGAEAATRRQAQDTPPATKTPALDGGQALDRKRAMLDLARHAARVLDPAELLIFSAGCESRAKKLHAGDLEPLDAYEEAPEFFARARDLAKALDLA